MGRQVSGGFLNVKIVLNHLKPLKHDTHYSQDEIKDDLKHKTRGVVSMANSGPNTNGSQWFVTYAPQPSLDLKYTVFGKVIDGWDTLDELERIPDNPKNHRPMKGSEASITSVTIHANPLAA